MRGNRFSAADARPSSSRSQPVPIQSAQVAAERFEQIGPFTRWTPLNKLKWLCGRPVGRVISGGSPEPKNSGPSLYADRAVLRDSREMQTKVDTFCVFRALSNRQKSVSGKARESGRSSARQRAVRTRSLDGSRKQKLQPASDRWYSLGVIFSNRGGNSGLRSLSARRPPETPSGVGIPPV